MIKKVLCFLLVTIMAVQMIPGGIWQRDVYETCMEKEGCKAEKNAEDAKLLAHVHDFNANLLSIIQNGEYALYNISGYASAAICVDVPPPDQGLI